MHGKCERNHTYKETSSSIDYFFSDMSFTIIFYRANSEIGTTQKLALYKTSNQY